MALPAARCMYELFIKASDPLIWDVQFGELILPRLSQH